MFYLIILSIHIGLSVLLVGLVLLQQGKGADVGVSLGGGANSIFGAGGATSLITRVTTGTAILFMLTSLLLVREHTNFPGSIVGHRGETAAPELPVTAAASSADMEEAATTTDSKK